MSLWLKVAALITLLVTAAAVQSWRLNSARQLTDQQAQTLAAQQAALTEQASQLKTLADLSERNNAEQARLRSLAADTQAALTERQKTLARLQRENEALKRWADTALPDDIIRLRQRPAITGGRAYREWLSPADALPVSGGQPANQRRAE